MKDSGLHISKISGIRITEKQKYSIIIYPVAMVHFILAFIFGYYKVLPLFLFNIISIAVYLLCTQWIQKEKFMLVYLTTYIEIVLHSFIATICVGWKYGFAQYIIAMVPVGFYICYTMETEHRKMVIATVSAFLATASFICCKILSFYVEPIYKMNMRTEGLGLYIFNSICMFIFLIAFSLIFLAEITSSRKQLHHQNAILEKIASIDPLTGLYNRRSMDVFLKQALESEFSFAIILCDVDNFKRVNDTYGHDFGDVVLRDIAHITMDKVGDSGYVCRWGGEEILILVNRSTKEGAGKIAESIRCEVASHVFEMNHVCIHCTLTLGVSSYKSGQTVEQTITLADNNLYEGKRSGKNRVVA